jgi:hypothetical protein
MRDLPVRRFASSALCATLVLGMAGPAAVAADRPARGRPQVAAAPVPETDALLARVRTLTDADGVVPPVTELLNAVLKADNGQLPKNEAARLGKAVKDAIAKAGAAAPTPTVSPGQGNALAALQKAVDRLIAAVTSGDSRRVLPAAAGVLASLVKVVVVGLVGNGVPNLPPMPGLPPMPSLPPMPNLTPMPDITEIPSDDA